MSNRTKALLRMVQMAMRRLKPRTLLRHFKNELKLNIRFFDSLSAYSQASGIPERELEKSMWPCIYDATPTTNIEPIYFYQDAWAFELIVRENPELHVDIASHHKYVALLSKVVPVTMVDIRPLELPMETISFQEGSILNLPYEDGILSSVSSICVIEHIGLGRYNDPIDPFGSEKAIEEIKRVTAIGGRVYISVPISENERIEFNAQRIFTEETLLEKFGNYEVIDKKYIYGKTFSSSRGHGFGIGCYALKRIY